MKQGEEDWEGAPSLRETPFNLLSFYNRISQSVCQRVQAKPLICCVVGTACLPGCLSACLILPANSIKLNGALHGFGGRGWLLHYARQMPSDKDDKDVSMLLIALLANDDGVDIRKDNMMSSSTKATERHRGGIKGAQWWSEGNCREGAQSYLITMPCIMGLSLTSCLPAYACLCVCDLGVLWAWSCACWLPASNINSNSSMYINCNCCYCLCFCIYDSVDVQALQINYVYDMFATEAYSKQWKGGMPQLKFHAICAVDKTYKQLI